MYNEPLNTGGVKLFLNVISDGSGRFQIEEPVGFDALNFILETEEGRYGRDVEFSEVDLIFYKDADQVTFEKLLEIDGIYGFESKAEFILQVDGVDFAFGEMEFSKVVTDQITEFAIQIFQSSEKAKIKRKKEINIDLFSDVDLEGNPIEPVETHKMLLKAKPVVQVSNWAKTDFYFYTGNSFDLNALYQNPLRNITSFGIDNTLTPLSSYVVANNDQMSEPDNFKLIDAVNDLTDNTITFEDIKIKYLVPEGEPFENTGSWFLGQVRIEFEVYVGTGTPPSNYGGGYNLDFTYEYQSTYTLSGQYGELTGTVDEYLVTIEDATFDLQTIPRDNGLWGVFDLRRIFTITDWQSGSITINSTATGIDSVIDVVKLEDAQRQVVKSINGFSVNNPEFDGGEFKNNFIFTGNLVRQFTDKPFNISFKDITDHLQELNCDYQINENSVDFIRYKDFYQNIELAAFGSIPFTDFEITYNERYLINQFNYKYRKYEQDKDEKNTINAVHTEAQYFIPNDKAENKKPVDVSFTRDPFKIEFLRARGTQSDGTTSLSGDEDIFVIEGIELAPNTERSISATFIHNIDADDNLQLLNDGTFNWTLLGIGSTLTINATQNIGNYNVVDIDFSVITLQRIGGIPTFSGESLTTITYLIEGVLWTNRTNEGFTSITGVENPNNYSNLNYTIRRNLEQWKPYISTATLFTDRDVTNTSFINNPTLVTTKTGETPLVEISGILNTDLNDAILSPRKLKTTIVDVDFYTYTNLLSSIQTQKGFIRVADNKNRMLKVHPTKLDYTWKDNVLVIESEIRLESEFVAINTNNQIIEINETGYDTEYIYPISFKAENDFVQIFDKNTVPLINKTRFDFIKVNGVEFETVEQLAIAINEL